jgi:hypothetical protein
LIFDNQLAEFRKQKAISIQQVGLQSSAFGSHELSSKYSINLHAPLNTAYHLPLTIYQLVVQDLHLHPYILPGVNAVLIMDHAAATPGLDVHPVTGYVIRYEPIPDHFCPLPG